MLPGTPPAKSLNQPSLPSISLKAFCLWLVRRRKRLQVTGPSMLPLLQPGEEVLFNPKAYRHQKPQPGDIVVAYHPQQAQLKIIKRVVHLNPDGTCHIEGDNATASTDSRHFGPLPCANILGQVVCKF